MTEPWTRCTSLPHSHLLEFRKWRADDMELALGLWGDPQVTELIDARTPLSREQVQELLMRQVVMDQEHGIQYWPIFLRESGQHVGCCGLRPYDSDKRVLETGFQIRSGFWRQGIATEAARAVIDCAFAELRVSGLFAGHNPRNAPSRALLRKLGFRFTHEEYYEPTGLMHPSYLLDEVARKSR